MSAKNIGHNKIKILYRGSPRDISGWGFCAREEIRAIAQHYETVVRTIDYNPTVKDPIIENLIAGDIDGITHSIQHVLPHEYIVYGDVYNIGYLELETENITNSFWPTYISMMDEIWVVNPHAYDAVKSACPNTKVTIVPHVINYDKYRQQFSKLSIPRVDGNHIFYTIATDTARKNLYDLLVAFHLEFDPVEPVSLVIKTNKNLDELCRKVKRDLKLYNKETDYKMEVVIPHHMSDIDMLNLHYTCDTYVTCSRGESWNQPVVDAIGMGKQVITTSNGIASILFNENELVKSYKTCVIGEMQFPNYQNGYDTWQQVDILDLRQKMRRKYMGHKTDFTLDVNSQGHMDLIKSLLEGKNNE